MKAEKQLRKPRNWQDFESLCKKLWGEIWQCKEIKKNGRQGQSQNGVDVYGIPSGESEYFGIQCKGKDDYTKSELTEKEIDKEIEKALSFKPKLKKFYFATTANKDVKIEEYIRNKNLDNISKGLFEIHLFSREDIVDLIEENRNTYKWYVDSINFKDEYDIEVLFEDGTKSLNLDVYFKELTKHYKYIEKKDILPKDLSEATIAIQNMVKNMEVARASFPGFNGGEDKGENLSWGEFRIILKNNGNKPLENFKIYLDFEGDLESLGNRYSNYSYVLMNNRDVFCGENSCTLEPNNNKILASQDHYLFNTIDIKPKVAGGKIKLNWKIVSNYHSEEGVLEININSTTVPIKEIIEVEKHEDMRTEINIEDFYQKDIEEAVKNKKEKKE